jgi:Xaa-Pro aminopeptidase
VIQRAGNLFWLRYTDSMRLDIAAVQSALAIEGLDGWLLYDFHGSNPVAAAMAGLAGTGKLTTRRWYYMIPARGKPRKLVHAIESHNLDALPGEKLIYAGREALSTGLDTLLSGTRRLAMEYSPQGAIPYVARVDAGTIESIRERGVDVVSSGDLVQRFEACWDADAIATHHEASDRLYRVKDRAFAAMAERLRAGTPTTEYDIQQLMAGWIRDEGMLSDSEPVVAVGAHAGDPHYQPGPEGGSTIGRDALVLLDLWAKLARPGAVYADITWVCFTGSRVPDEQAAAFMAVAAARDAAAKTAQEAAAAGADLRGWQVDRAARTVLQQAGYGGHILHRTGHSLGQEVHGNGVHMDDYETHDDRKLLPGSGFTIEPGLYFEQFGVRTEINMVYGSGSATVTGPAQAAIVALF